MDNRGVFIDTAAYALSSVVVVFQPILYPVLWISLIILGKAVYGHDQRACGYIKAFVISAPMGILSCMIALEHGFSTYTAIGIGALAAVVAEHVFRGEWFTVLIDIIKERFSR